MLGEGLEKPKKSPRGALSTVQNKNGGVTARLVVFEINKVPYHHSVSEISRSESAPEPPIGGPVFGPNQSSHYCCWHLIGLQAEVLVFALFFHCLYNCDLWVFGLFCTAKCHLWRYYLVGGRGHFYYIWHHFGHGPGGGTRDVHARTCLGPVLNLVGLPDVGPGPTMARIKPIITVEYPMLACLVNG